MRGQTLLFRRVLFVDDDSSYLDTMDRCMTSLSEGRWQVFRAETASRAMTLLNEESIDLIAIDVQMPVVDGLQFLALLNRRFPDIPKVVLTGFATKAYRVACLSNGAELFLQKAMSAEEQLLLFRTLDQVMDFRPQEGFRGVLRRVGLPDVLQMECLGSKTSILEVSSARVSGRIFIQDGAVIHAETGSFNGEDAFHLLMGLRGGEFRLERFTEPAEVTIDTPWEFLVVESARRRDEGVMPEKPESDSEKGDTTFRARRAAQGNPDQSGDTSTKTARKPAPSSSVGRRNIDEMLLCSNDGLVMREHQVINSQRWINFVEFLSQKARRIAQGMGMGDLERFEASADGERLLTLMRSDHAVMVRCREEVE